ncbi:MAG: T9SS type A sorting domain-containing protein [Bacteroidota bacterium]
MKNILLTIIYVSLATALAAQCFEPDASIWEDTWQSCQVSANPKAAYGNTHWVQYDFGAVRNLSKSWVWNTNAPNRLNQGFREVKIDYSIDGINWTYWGELNFPKAQGNAVYGGFPGPDLVGIQARYVLLTALSNYGDPNCAGIAEIKFNLLPDQMDIPRGEGLPCVDFEEIIVVDVSDTEAYILWEFEPILDDEDEEDIFEDEEIPFLFTFRYRVLGAEEWIAIELREAEIFLQDLDPLTTYEFQVISECGQETVDSYIDEFTTLEEGAQGCYRIDEELYIESIEGTTVVVVWEGREDVEEYVVTYVNFLPNAELVEVEVTDTRIVLEGLLPNLEYMLIVAVECNGVPIYSSPLYFSTQEALTNTDTPEALEAVVSIFPNPTSGQFTLGYETKQADTLSYTIHDAMGRVLQRGTVVVAPGGNQFMLDLSTYADGVYLVHAVSTISGRYASKRVVKGGR